MHSETVVKRILKTEAVMADRDEPLVDPDHGSEPGQIDEEDLEMQNVTYEETDDETGMLPIEYR